MGVAKASLIVVGTVASLGGVLYYQPPHQSLSLGGGGLKGLGGGTPATTPAATPTPTPSETPTVATPATTAATPKKTKKPPANPATTPATPKKTKPPKTTGLINGTFTGAVSSTVYGPVQIAIVVKDSKIVGVNPIQLPTATAYDVQLNGQAVPILTSETIAASSSNIAGVSGASYTSQGWYDSLVSALGKAGLKG